MCAWPATTTFWAMFKLCFRFAEWFIAVVLILFCGLGPLFLTLLLRLSWFTVFASRCGSFWVYGLCSQLCAVICEWPEKSRSLKAFVLLFSCYGLGFGALGVSALGFSLVSAQGGTSPLMGDTCGSKVHRCPDLCHRLLAAWRLYNTAALVITYTIVGSYRGPCYSYRIKYPKTLF